MTTMRIAGLRGPATALLALLALLALSAGSASAAHGLRHKRHHRHGHATRRHRTSPRHHRRHRRAAKRPSILGPSSTATAGPTRPSSSPSASGACTDTQLAPAPGNLGRIAAATLCLVNQQRARAGLGALADNGTLDQVARGHSQDMTAHLYFDHISPGGSTPVTRMTQAGYISNRVSWVVGENIAWGTGSLATPSSIVDSWMHSPEHRANILDRRYHDSGIGISAAAPQAGLGGQAGGTYTQEFGLVG